MYLRKRMNNKNVEKMLQKLINHKTDKIHLQLFRFFIVGGIAFIIDFTTLFALTHYFGIYYLISAFIAFILGITTNYILSIKWVFNKRSIDNNKIEFGIFAFLGVIGLTLTESLLWFFTQQLNIYYLYSKIFSSFIIFFFNFFIRKFLLFR